MHQQPDSTFDKIKIVSELEIGSQTVLKNRASEKDFATLISSLGTTNATTVINAKEEIIDDLTIPSNVALIFLRGGSLNISAGKTVTINGHVDAGLYQIFEGAGSVSFGTGAVKEVYPQWWGAKGDGVTDDTAAIKAAINSLSAGIVFFPPGNYLVTDTINLVSGIILEGSNKSICSKQTGIEDNPITLITFAPTSEKDLFYLSTGGSDYAANIGVRNITLRGNANSRYALHLNRVSQSLFENIVAYHFHMGAYSISSMSNRFKNVYFGYCGSNCFYYVGTMSTSDVWDTCFFRSTPAGGTIKSGFGIVFDNCLFESLGQGVRIDRECGEIVFMNPYVENVPTGSGGFVFQLGCYGTTTWVGNNLTIFGGLYSGRIEGSGGKTGSWLLLKYCKGIRIFGGLATKYDYGIRSSDHTVTDNNSIFVSGPSFRNVTTLYEDVEGSYGKIYGHYPTGNLDVATVPKVRGNKIQIIALSIYANNAAAIAGGLAVGDFYRTNANPDTVCVVH